MPKLRTSLTLSISGYEKTLSPLVVEYEHHKATRDRMEGPLAGPGEPEHVEIGLVYREKDKARDPLPEWMIDEMSAELEAACLEDWRDAEEHARDRAYEERRDELMFARRPQAAAE